MREPVGARCDAGRRGVEGGGVEDADASLSCRVLRAAVERLTKESTDHAYIQTVCEDTLVQLMDSNERLRREKQAWEAAELQG